MEDDHENNPNNPKPKKAKIIPLKPSGVIIKMEVDPNQSEEEDVNIKNKKKPSKRESNFDKEKDLNDKEKKEDDEKRQEKLREELRAKKVKENQRLLKDINKNFNRKDKRDTTRFLVRHGLSPEEAKQYIQLGAEFDLKNLDPK